MTLEQALPVQYISQVWKAPKRERVYSLNELRDQLLTAESDFTVAVTDLRIAVENEKAVERALAEGGFIEKAQNRLSGALGHARDERTRAVSALAKAEEKKNTLQMKVRVLKQDQSAS